MIIGIDGNEANIKTKVGVNQMAFEILWEFYKLEDNKKKGIKYLIYLKDAPGNELPPENNYWHYKIIPGGGIWILRKLLPELIKHPVPNIFFTPSHYLPPILMLPKVCMITDIGYLEFSGQFNKFDFWQLKWWTAISLIISKYIITISVATSKDIVRHYPFTSKKIKVTYLGPNRVDLNPNISQKFVRQTLKKYRITKNYILFVSTLKPSKNVDGLIDAFSLVKKHHDFQLVIAGKKGWQYDSIFKKVKELGLQKDIIFTGYLEEAEKPALFNSAKVFCTPSYWEGFGIDILNAFAAGVPVVVSKVASIPEVAGEAGIYVNPNEPSSIAKGLEKVINMSSKEYNNQVMKGFRQLSKFSWKKTAADILEVLEMVAKK